MIQQIQSGQVHTHLHLTRVLTHSLTYSLTHSCPDQLIIDYYFEAIQEIIIKVYDQDDKAALTDLARHDYIGECSFLLTDLMCSKSHKLELKINGPKNMGYVEIRGTYSLTHSLTYSPNHSLTHSLR